jgi:polyisoprenyl-phosphate glycosyltransferase
MLISIVVPVFDELESLSVLIAELTTALSGEDWEIVFVNDGSKDGSGEFLKNAAAEDHRIRVLNFSRNFGHQAAITAGLDFAEGDAVVVMDADLQDPPELLPRMIGLYRQGFDVVSAQRVSRDGETLFKKWTASAFYRLMRRMVDRRLVQDVGDFRLFSRKAVLAIRSFREQHRFMRGLVAWLGLDEVVLPFHRHNRAAGQTKYSLFKMLRLAWTAISSFSALPLRLTLLAGLALSGAGFVYLLYVIYLALATNKLVPGWASVVVLQCIFSGMILVALGLVGDYVARSYEELKQRPLYVVKNSFNVETRQPPLERACILLDPPASSVSQKAINTSARGIAGAA